MSVGSPANLERRVLLTADEAAVVLRRHLGPGLISRIGSRARLGARRSEPAHRHVIPQNPRLAVVAEIGLRPKCHGGTTTVPRYDLATL